MEKEKRDWYKILLYAAPIVVIFFWLANWILVEILACSTEQGGQFGDRFGASTSLFGGITIILLLLTIHLQRKEIAEGKKEFKQQNRTLSYQKFDNTFFNLITLRNNVAKEAKQALEIYQTHIITDAFTKDTYNMEVVIKHYKQNLTDQVEKILGQYINNFEVLIDLITTKKKKDSRDKYFRIFGAQLTRDEKIFLFYYIKLSGEQVPYWNELHPILFRGMYYNHFHNPTSAQSIDKHVKPEIFANS